MTTTLNGVHTSLLSAATFSTAGYEVDFSQFAGGADYLAVFDQYRIREIQVTIRPQMTTAVVGFAAPLVYSVIDLDDSTPLGTAAIFREYANCTTTQYETLVRSWKPCISVPAYVTGGAATGAMSVPAPWIDVATINVAHFGFKLGIEPNSGGTSSQLLSVDFKALVDFRTTR